MTITVLDIAADGTQTLRKQEVPKDYFNPTPAAAPLTKDELPLE